MLEFADAKRIIKTIEAKHAEDVECIDLMIELFTMLEESTAAKIIDLQQEVDAWKERAADIDQARQSLQVELDELNKAYHDSVNALQVATHNTMDAVKPKGGIEIPECSVDIPMPKKKRGRPKKNPEDAKVETYESDLEDLSVEFGVKALSKELVEMGVK
jgi:allophanate hydrolase subunit 1